MIQKHFNILGMKVKDKVTGFKGVATSLTFDLYGCVQVLINPGLAKDGKQLDSYWYDIARLEIISKEPVMDRPDFCSGHGPVAEGKKGPSEKPRFFKP